MTAVREHVSASQLDPGALCGYGIDRRCSSLLQALEPPHHDELLLVPSWPAWLGFGPDALAGDVPRDADTLDVAPSWHRSGCPDIWRGRAC